MNPERVEKLKNYSKNNPDDPFPKYALAMEYLGQNNELVTDLFTELLEDHPDYLPTYYHAAIHFSELGEIEIAKELFTKGIELSKDDAKTKRELENAYQNFLFENDL